MVAFSRKIPSFLVSIFVRMPLLVQPFFFFRRFFTRNRGRTLITEAHKDFLHPDNANTRNVVGLQWMGRSVVSACTIQLDKGTIMPRCAFCILSLFSDVAAVRREMRPPAMDDMRARSSGDATLCCFFLVLSSSRFPHAVSGCTCDYATFHDCFCSDRGKKRYFERHDHIIH